MNKYLVLFLLPILSYGDVVRSYWNTWELSNPVQSNIQIEKSMKDLEGKDVVELRELYKKQLFTDIYRDLVDIKGKGIIPLLEEMWQKNIILMPVKEDLEINKEYLIKEAITGPEKQARPKPNHEYYVMVKLDRDVIWPDVSSLKKGGEELGYASFTYKTPVNNKLTVTMEWMGGVFNIINGDVSFPIVYTPVITVEVEKDRVLNIYKIDEL